MCLLLELEFFLHFRLASCSRRFTTCRISTHSHQRVIERSRLSHSVTAMEKLSTYRDLVKMKSITEGNIITKRGYEKPINALALPPRGLNSHPNITRSKPPKQHFVRSSANQTNQTANMQFTRIIAALGLAAAAQACTPGQFSCGNQNGARTRRCHLQLQLPRQLGLLCPVWWCYMLHAVLY